MGREPDEVLVGFYLCKDCPLGETKAGEAANRLLRYSVDAKDWVGVTWEEMKDTACAEIVEHNERERHDEAISAYNAKWRWFWILLIPPFWLLLLFVKFPEHPALRSPKLEKLPAKSFAFREGVMAIQQGLRELLERRLIELRGDVYYPTPRLIASIPHPSE